MRLAHFLSCWKNYKIKLHRKKRLAKPFYSKTILQIVSVPEKKRLAKPFYSKTILQIVSKPIIAHSRHYTGNRKTGISSGSGSDPVGLRGRI